MSPFNVTVTLFPANYNAEPIDVELLVGSGVMFTSVPQSVLDQLKIRPSSGRIFRTADGGSAERKIGVVRIAIDGNEPPAPIAVVFGQPHDRSVLGVTALESMGLKVDPVAGVLLKTDLLMLRVRP